MIKGIKFSIRKQYWKDTYDWSNLIGRKIPIHQYFIDLSIGNFAGKGIYRTENKSKLGFWKAFYRAYQNLDRTPESIFGHLPNNIKLYVKHPNGLQKYISINSAIECIDSQITIKENGN